MLALIVLAAGGAAPASNDAVLATLNQTSLDAYRSGRQQYITDPGPLIIAGSDLTFLVNGQEWHAGYTPPIYTVLKSLSHPYLGTIVLLVPFAGDPAMHRDLWRPRLQALRDGVAGVLPRLGQLGLDRDSVIRNRYILQHLLGFMDATLAKGTYTSADLTALGRAIGPLLLANANVAAKAQIDLMKREVDSWRAKVGPDAWLKVMVVVEGPAQPRTDNLQYSFFRYELGAQAPTHLFYAENVFDQAGALKFIGTIQADRSLSVITFDDPLRMQRDLLGDAADSYLAQVFGRLGQVLPGN